MNKTTFIRDLKASLSYHFHQIEEEKELISFGIYTDGDASTIGIYYNTRQFLQDTLADLDPNAENYLEEKLYYTFFMEEWIADISERLEEERLSELNDRIDKFGSKEYENGNENYKDEIFDLFVKALHELKSEGLFKKEKDDFFLHLEVSDSWIDKEMLNRISLLHSKERFIQYQQYAKDNNA